MTAPGQHDGGRVRQLHRVRLGSQELELPVVPVAPELAIALLVVPDHGVRFLARAGNDLAALVTEQAPQVVAGTATQGIPVAIELTRALGLDDYLVLQKTRKIHLADALTEPLRSITTAEQQTLMLDRARAAGLAGRRVVLVDDVISTGGSVLASLRLLRAAGADVVAIAALLAEDGGWRDALGPDAALVHTLGAVPLFAPSGDARWEPAVTAVP